LQIFAKNPNNHRSEKPNSNKDHNIIELARITFICQLIIIASTKLLKPGTAAVQMPSITFNSTALQLNKHRINHIQSTGLLQQGNYKD